MVSHNYKDNKKLRKDFLNERAKNVIKRTKIKKKANYNKIKNQNLGKKTYKKRKSKLIRDINSQKKSIKKSPNRKDLPDFSRDGEDEDLYYLFGGGCDVPSISKIRKKIKKNNKKFDKLIPRLEILSNTLEFTHLDNVRRLYGESLLQMRKEFCYEKQIEEYDQSLKSLKKDATMDQAKLMTLEQELKTVKNGKIIMNQELETNMELLKENIKEFKTQVKKFNKEKNKYFKTIDKYLVKRSGVFNKKSISYRINKIIGKVDEYKQIRKTVGVGEKGVVDKSILKKLNYKVKRKFYKYDKCMPKFKKVVEFNELITKKKNKLLIAANDLASKSIILQVYIKDSKVDFDKKENEFKKWKKSMEKFYEAIVKIVPGKSEQNIKKFKFPLKKKCIDIEEDIKRILDLIQQSSIKPVNMNVGTDLLHAVSLMTIVKNGYIAIQNDLLDFKSQFLDLRSTKYLKTIITDIISLHITNVQNLMTIKFHLENMNNYDTPSIFAGVEKFQDANALKRMTLQETSGMGRAVQMGLQAPPTMETTLIQDPKLGSFSNAISGQLTAARPTTGTSTIGGINPMYSPAMGVPGMGVPGMGMMRPGMAVPGMGMGMGMMRPGMAVPGMGMGMGTGMMPPLTTQLGGKLKDGLLDIFDKPEKGIDFYTSSTFSIDDFDKSIYDILKELNNSIKESKGVDPKTDKSIKISINFLNDIKTAYNSILSDTSVSSTNLNINIKKYLKDDKVVAELMTKYQSQFKFALLNVANPNFSRKPVDFPWNTPNYKTNADIYNNALTRNKTTHPDEIYTSDPKKKDNFNFINKPWLSNNINYNYIDEKNKKLINENFVDNIINSTILTNPLDIAQNLSLLKSSENIELIGNNIHNERIKSQINSKLEFKKDSLPNPLNQTLTNSKLPSGNIGGELAFELFYNLFSIYSDGYIYKIDGTTRIRNLNIPNQGGFKLHSLTTANEFDINLYNQYLNNSEQATTQIWRLLHINNKEKTKSVFLDVTSKLHKYINDDKSLDITALISECDTQIKSEDENLLFNKFYKEFNKPSKEPKDDNTSIKYESIYQNGSYLILFFCIIGYLIELEIIDNITNVYDQTQINVPRYPIQDGLQTIANDTISTKSYNIKDNNNKYFTNNIADYITNGFNLGIQNTGYTPALTTEFKTLLNKIATNINNNFKKTPFNQFNNIFVIPKCQNIVNLIYNTNDGLRFNTFDVGGAGVRDWGDNDPIINMISTYTGGLGTPIQDANRGGTQEITPIFLNNLDITTKTAILYRIIVKGLRMYRNIELPVGNPYDYIINDEIGDANVKEAIKKYNKFELDSLTTTYYPTKFFDLSSNSTDKDISINIMIEELSDLFYFISKIETKKAKLLKDVLKKSTTLASNYIEIISLYFEYKHMIFILLSLINPLKSYLSLLKIELTTDPAKAKKIDTLLKDYDTNFFNKDKELKVIFTKLESFDDLDKYDIMKTRMTEFLENKEINDFYDKMKNLIESIKNDLQVNVATAPILSDEHTQKYKKIDNFLKDLKSLYDPTKFSDKKQFENMDKYKKLIKESDDEKSAREEKLQIVNTLLDKMKLKLNEKCIDKFRLLGNIDAIMKSEYDETSGQCIEKPDNELDKLIDSYKAKLGNSQSNEIAQSKNYQLKTNYVRQLGDSIDSVFTFKEVEEEETKNN